MRCDVCGAGLSGITTDLPFEVQEPCIVILKGLPVLQCALGPLDYPPSGKCQERLLWIRVECQQVRVALTQ